VGIIRVLLAAAVVFWHAPAWSGHDPQVSVLSPLPGYYAVQAFFVISGFYMQLLQGKYASAPTWVFYTNRYSRLAASYWIVLGVTAVLITLKPGISYPPAIFLADFKPDNAFDWPLLVFSNLTMIGQDLLAVLLGLYSNTTLLPQTWSLALELWFYLLVPVLWRASDRTLWTIVALSAALRLIFAASPLAFFPWQQRFFPVEIMFFLVGMLSFRNSGQLLSIVRHRRFCLPIIGTFVVFGGWLMPWPTTTTWYACLPLAAIFYVSLPAIFAATRHSQLDRLIGEFSYPIYLLHVTLWYFFEPPFLLLFCIVVAAPLVFLVDRPLEHWRNSRLRARTVAAVALRHD
jgi:peptidoglycan/LPS O-acetylase OafA/YrhL